MLRKHTSAPPVNNRKYVKYVVLLWTCEQICLISSYLFLFVKESRSVWKQAAALNMQMTEQLDIISLN